MNITVAYQAIIDRVQGSMAGSSVAIQRLKKGQNLSDRYFVTAVETGEHGPVGCVEMPIKTLDLLELGAGNLLSASPDRTGSCCALEGTL